MLGRKVQIRHPTGVLEVAIGKAEGNHRQGMPIRSRACTGRL
jgi:hypothetical protein